ncbi:MAG TPA: hypothetical protein PKC28_14420 [Bdellovibrionales bacterium]|nr:hypothetical protein [Bdellovibrionales bacterium]
MKHEFRAPGTPRPEKLQGAPGHRAEANMSRASKRGRAPHQDASLNTVSTAVTKELAGLAPGVIDDILAKVGNAFGQGNLKKWSKLIGNGKDGIESSLMNIVHAAAPTLPKDVSLADLTALVKWKPVKDKLAKRPVATAASVAAGVGALYLLREYLNRQGGSSGTPRASGKARKTTTRKAKSRAKAARRPSRKSVH